MLCSDQERENMTRRGHFIVFEGGDRAGKSTQAKLLQDFLNSKSIKTELVKYPDRTNTLTGPLIQNYLSGKADLSDQAIHLLFSANRWELQASLLSKLNSGITVIADRYVYSGIAYSHAKGLDLNWCLEPDRGLIKPDAVFYLCLDPAEASKRSDYGLEKYENLDFQTRVSSSFSSVFKELNQDVYEIQVHRSIQEIAQEIASITTLIDSKKDLVTF
jgi:dTMP kinase